MNMKLKFVITLVSLMMMTGLAMADPNPMNLVEPPSESGFGTLAASAIIDNGVVQMGINDLGNLNVPGGTWSMPSSPTTIVGLRYMPTNGESTAPGCLCEGWGAADANTGTTGYANEAVGTANLNLISFTNTASEATSIVEIPDASGAPKLRVKHYYHPSIETDNLYQVDVEITNLGSTDVDLRYRRVMDWDIAPDTFNEFVTIDNGSASELAFTSNNGFASANPLSGPSSIGGFTGSFVDEGPEDHGALFDFNFGTLAPGKTKSFKTFYGAAGNESDADDALAAVGAEAYSYGQPNFDPASGYGPITGTPHTFIFAFGNVGGSPIFPQCSDGVDNDGDGAIDFPADSDCSSKDDPKEGPDTIPVPEFPTIALPIVSILGLMFLVSRMKKN